MALGRMKTNRGGIAGLTMCAFAALVTVACERTGDDAGSTSAPAAKSAATAGEVVATYQGRTLTSTQVLQELERLPGPSRSYLSAPERKRQFVENMVMNDLLYAEGAREGLDRDADVERQVNDLRKRLVVQRVMRKYQTPPTVTDEQVRAYYDQNQDLYSTTQVRANHILVKDEETAKQIYAELKANPGKFADLAKEKSTDTGSARRGGELGLFGQGRMVPEFERVAFRLKPNEISEPVKSQYGWHIITITERKEGEQKPFDQVKEQIRATLRNQGLQQQVQGHMDELRKAANLQIDEAALARVEPPPAPASPAGGSPHAGMSGHAH